LAIAFARANRCTPAASAAVLPRLGDQPCPPGAAGGPLLVVVVSGPGSRRGSGSGPRRSGSSAAGLREVDLRLRGTVDALSVGVTVHGAMGSHLRQPSRARPARVTEGPRPGGRPFGVDGEVLGEDGTPLGTRRSRARRSRQRTCGAGRGRGPAPAWVGPHLGPGQRGAASCPDGRANEVVCTFNDITERRRALEQIRHLATTTALHPASHRELFFDRMSVPWSARAGAGAACAALHRPRRLQAHERHPRPHGRGRRAPHHRRRLKAAVREAIPSLVRATVRDPASRSRSGG